METNNLPGSIQSIRQLGEPLAFRTSIVTTRDLLAFASAIGATEEQFMDDCSESGIVAAPGFNSSYEWPLQLNESYLKALKIPREDLFKYFFHAFQDIRYHSPIKPNQVLNSSISITSVRRIRSGTLITSRVATIDAETKSPVTTTYYGSLMKGLVLKDLNESAVPLALGVDFVGPHLSCDIEIAPGLAHVYAECARIWNPIHTERKAALDAGLKNTILHGTCSLALSGLQLLRSNKAPSRLTRLGARFSAPVETGTRITLDAVRCNEDDSLQFRVRRADGVVCLSHGVATLEHAP